MSRRDSTTWRYDLEPVDGGTRVTHSYEITALPVRPIRAVFGVLHARTTATCGRTCGPTSRRCATCSPRGSASG